MNARRYSTADRLLIGLSQGLGRGPGALPTGARSGAPSEGPSVAGAGPTAVTMAQDGLPEAARQQAASLMRVNHAGEVAAQGLYHGQALTARDPATRAHLLEAADEEQAHLQWCEQRLAELGDGPSRLRPLWYGGSFVMGAAAGLLGDRWSLGFVAETERQVSEHLDEHLALLPRQDQRSRAVLQDMRRDEQRHGEAATQRGGRPLPAPVRGLMRQLAQVMKRAAARY